MNNMLVTHRYSMMPLGLDVGFRNQWEEKEILVALRDNSRRIERVWIDHLKDELEDERDYEESIPIPDPDEVVDRAMESALGLLNLQPNWDEAGAHSYKPEDLVRVCKLIKVILREAQELGMSIAAPKINPAASGGIDICWDTPERGLAINVSSDPDENPVFYYDRPGSDERLAVQGRIVEE